MEQMKNIIHEDKTLDATMFFSQEDHDHIPEQFIWSNEEAATEVLNAPVIDLQCLFSKDKEATLHAANLVKEACIRHGFFQVINHGVDPALFTAAYEHGCAFFKLPVTNKLMYKKKEGSVVGFVSAHSNRFSNRWPWKELLTFEHHQNGPEEVVAEFFKNSPIGTQLQETGSIYQKYCDSMKKTALEIFELLEISLGVDGHKYYRELFEDCISIMRVNNYPRCNQPSLTNGVGPHRDPTTITLLYQDQVGGLEVFVDDKWKSVPPHPNALVINIGDTFQALSNGKYKSCLHRVMVNRYQPRLSLAFFVCPRGDKQLKPPQELVDKDGRREYPDFKWDDFLYFTQKHYRASEDTLEQFTKWLQSNKSTDI